MPAYCGHELGTALDNFVDIVGGVMMAQGAIDIHLQRKDIRKITDGSLVLLVLSRLARTLTS